MNEQRGVRGGGAWLSDHLPAYVHTFSPPGLLPTFSPLTLIHDGPSHGASPFTLFSC